MFPCAVLGILRNTGSVSTTFMFPLPITIVSLKKPLAAQVPLAAAERTWALVHSQDAS